MRRLRYVVADTPSGGERIDIFLTKRLNPMSRSHLKAWAEEIQLNGNPAKPSRIVHPGDTIELILAEQPQPPFGPTPLQLSVLYEDEHVAVIDKPSGLVVHPGIGHYENTLVQGLLYRYPRLADNFADVPIYPGLVHRLDKDTSGVMIVAKNFEVREFLAQQFFMRQVDKCYIAIVMGTPQRRSETIRLPLQRDPAHRIRFAAHEQGKDAETRYRLIRSFGDYSFIAFYPRTGRTHQIRVHSRTIGCPILGDRLYAKSDRRFPAARLMLHAYRLRIRIPGRPGRMLFRAPLPTALRETLKVLREKQRALGHEAD